MPKQCPANWKWCFTFNNYTEVDIVDVVDVFSNAKDIMYFFRKEIGEQGTPHLQGVVWCTRRTSKGRRAAFRPFTLTKNKRIHWEPLKSSVQQHVDYCGGYGDHSEKSGTGGDVYTNMTPEWMSLAQREKRALKVEEKARQEEYNDAMKRYEDMKVLWEKKQWCDMMRRTHSKIRPIDGWLDEFHKVLDIEKEWSWAIYHEKYRREGPCWWNVLSYGECNSWEEWLVYVRQFDCDV